MAVVFKFQFSLAVCWILSSSHLLVSSSIPQSSLDTAAPWSPPSCPQSCVCSLRLISDFDAPLRTVNCSSSTTPGSLVPPILIYPDIPGDTQSLIYRSAHLLALPSLSLPSLLHLDLAGNLIRTIPRVLAPELKVLNLDDNHLVNIGDRAFAMYPQLAQLKLSGNRLVSISPDAFSRLSSLEFLDLSHNKISYVNSRWWFWLQSLYELRLARNNFNIIQHSAFNNLKSLLSLDLSRNTLFKISPNGLQGLRSLEFFDLSQNSLSFVPREALAFAALTLKSIDLSQNPISDLGTKDFSNFAQLKDISLNGMARLRTVSASAFHDLPELVMLQLHDNSLLSYLDPVAFVGTPEMTHLLLHNNNLTHLSQSMVRGLGSLMEVSFYGNPLSCDCGASWMLERRSQMGAPALSFTESAHMTCAFPDVHRFKLFSTLTSGQLNSHCGPLLLPLFNPHMAKKAGDEVRLDCRGIGEPRPSVVWQLPDGRPLLSDGGEFFDPSPVPRYTLLNQGSTLILNSVGPADVGIYTCIVSNQFGSLEASTRLAVVPLEVVLKVASLETDSATLQWTGSDRSRHAFQVYYRKITATPSRRFSSSTSSKERPSPFYVQAATVTPIMNDLTLANLEHQSKYEACLSLKDSSSVIVHLSCVRFSTKADQALVAKSALEHSLLVMVPIILVMLVCYLVLICRTQHGEGGLMGSIRSVLRKKSCQRLRDRADRGDRHHIYEECSVTVTIPEHCFSNSNEILVNY